jgi:hypothetical protein
MNRIADGALSEPDARKSMAQNRNTSVPSIELTNTLTLQ